MFTLVLECLQEIPRAVMRDTRRTTDTLTVEVDSGLGASVIVATASQSLDFPSERPTIVITWNSTNPLPFMITPGPNLTYLDLSHGLSSRRLSELAAHIRNQFELRGYRFAHFDEVLSPRRFIIWRILLYGKRRVLEPLQKAYDLIPH